MEGFFEAATERLVRLAPCLLQVRHGMSVDLVETLALASDVSAVVHPLSDVADRVGQGMLMVSQREEWTFGVTMALVFPGGFTEWARARREIKAGLRGWSWDDQLDTPVEYAGGQTTQYSIDQNGGRWTHVLRFRTSFREHYEQLQ